MRELLMAVALAAAAALPRPVRADSGQVERPLNDIYERSRVASEMRRRGYVCAEIVDQACVWLRPQASSAWGACVAGPLGRMCERRTPSGAAWYYDFERPFVELFEAYESRLFPTGADTPARAVEQVRAKWDYRSAVSELSRRLAARLRFTEAQCAVIANRFVVDCEPARRAPITRHERAQVWNQLKRDALLDPFIPGPDDALLPLETLPAPSARLPPASPGDPDAMLDPWG